MPTNIRIIYAHEFIKAAPEGRLNLERSKELLMGIASVSDTLDDYNVFLDVRKTQLELSISDLWYLASELSAAHQTLPQRTAVLCPDEQFDYAGFFALCAQNRGLHINVFTSFEAAMEWLIEGDTASKHWAAPNNSNQTDGVTD